MKTITKEQYQFIENNFVASKEYNLDFDSINRMLSFEKKIKKIGFVIENEFTQTLFAYFCLFLFFALPICTACIFDYIEKLNYEIYPVFYLLIIFSWFLNVRIMIAISDKFTFERSARTFALFLLSFLSSSKCKYYKKHEILFNDYVNELKSKVSDKIFNQNNLINELRWLYNKSISNMQESLMSINNFEIDFNNLKEINTAFGFQLGLSGSEKSKLDSKYKNSAWWKIKEKIQETKTRLEDEIIKREKEEAIKRENAIEDERIRNVKKINSSCRI